MKNLKLIKATGTSRSKSRWYYDISGKNKIIKFCKENFELTPTELNALDLVLESFLDQPRKHSLKAIIRNEIFDMIYQNKDLEDVCDELGLSEHAILDLMLNLPPKYKKAKEEFLPENLLSWNQACLFNNCVKRIPYKTDSPLLKYPKRFLLEWHSLNISLADYDEAKILYDLLNSKKLVRYTPQLKLVREEGGDILEWWIVKTHKFKMGTIIERLSAFKEYKLKLIQLLSDLQKTKKPKKPRF